MCVYFLLVFKCDLYLRVLYLESIDFFLLLASKEKKKVHAGLKSRLRATHLNLYFKSKNEVCNIHVLFTDKSEATIAKVPKTI